MNNKNKLIYIGQITSVHGIKGCVKVQSYTEPTKKIFDYKTLVNDKGEYINIEFVNMAAHMLICKIKGVNTRNQAELLKGMKLYISSEELPATEEDEFYISDIEGLAVYDIITSEKIGVVNVVCNFGAGDLIEIIKENGEKILLPFNKNIFPDIKLTEKRIFINFPKYL